MPVAEAVDLALVIISVASALLIAVTLRKRRSLPRASELRALAQIVRGPRRGFWGGVVSCFEVQPKTPPYRPPPRGPSRLQQHVAGNLEAHAEAIDREVQRREAQRLKVHSDTAAALGKTPAELAAAVAGAVDGEFERLHSSQKEKR